jgi:hypothetical protein
MASERAAATSTHKQSRSRLRSREIFDFESLRCTPSVVQSFVKRRATVVSIAYDPECWGYRVRFHVPGLQRGEEWSTVQTDPPQDVRRTRFQGKGIELVILDRPRWKVGDEVTLTLEPYY